MIEGVTPNTLINLKAALYDQHQQSKKNRKVTRIERSSLASSADAAMEGRNEGVEKRIQQDLQSLKTEEYHQSMLYSQEALRKKAEIYRKMMKGELSDFEEENQLIDFEMKRFKRETKKDADYDVNNVPSLLLKETEHVPLSSSNSNSDTSNTSYYSFKGNTRINNSRMGDGTELARELVRKVRKQRKMKIQKRIAKIKKRALTNQKDATQQ